ncbi:MAG: GNAT family N-acetyltransferase [Methanothrix sp.]|jgi:GNAT superfamily N-acetyltransferase|nr:GNAT family N-acetyltransferase [Methanothrix sp.]
MDKIPSAELRVKRLNNRSNIITFCCVNEDLNNFLKDDALKAHDNMTSITYACSWKRVIVGFATLAAATIEVKQIDGPRIDGYTPNTYPCIKLARLAVDKRYAGRGIGQYLLFWVLGKFEKVSREIGCRYLTVDSKRESMWFYQKYDFVLAEKTINRPHPTFYLDMYLARENNNKSLCSYPTKNF